MVKPVIIKGNFTATNMFTVTNVFPTNSWWTLEDEWDKEHSLVISNISNGTGSPHWVVVGGIKILLWTNSTITVVSPVPFH